MKKILLIILGVITAGFLLVQLVPYGQDHTNPPVIAEPQWDSPQTRAYFMLACGDCHSNETVWPWYSKIAPVSMLVYQDVINGRRELNFSEYGEQNIDIEEITREILDGYMPLPIYLTMHPEARLTDAERAKLVEGLQNSLP